MAFTTSLKDFSNLPDLSLPPWKDVAPLRSFAKPAVDRFLRQLDPRLHVHVAPDEHLSVATQFLSKRILVALHDLNHLIAAESASTCNSNPSPLLVDDDMDWPAFRALLLEVDDLQTRASNSGSKSSAGSGADADADAGPSDISAHGVSSPPPSKSSAVNPSIHPSEQINPSRLGGASPRLA
uniref:Uncharacterized protein n=1 Tax=Mycena chlorophos TaxID=658473 RepID=A0ABQ0L428_MYCCL|nr:predicted protein [Mycena chlorophos]